MKANETLEELSLQQRLHAIKQAIRSIREEKQKRSYRSGNRRVL